MSEDLTSLHRPVMLERVVGLLAPAAQAPDSLVVDATLGIGGHAEALLAACPAARLLGIDRDADALALAAERLAGFVDRVTLVQATSDQLPAVAAERGIERVHAVLLDLGVSSIQLDRPERGFAYRADGPLDMRMDPSAGLSAAEVVATYDERDLSRILRDYGEERFAGRIARAIVAERESTPLTRTGQLADLVRAAIPAPARRTGGNPAKRTFQALRIEVNAELEVLHRTMDTALALLAVHGRMAVLAYHSLEDRIVKRGFVAGAHPPVPEMPPGFPVQPPAPRPTLRLLTKGAERPSEQELDDNPRASSARLRAVERLAAPPQDDGPGHHARTRRTAA